MSEVLRERFKILERCGKGGGNEVFRARDLLLGREVAVKRVKMEGDSAEIRIRRQLLLEEARHMATVTHPNVVALYDAIDDRTGVAIVMEYVEGAALIDRIRKEPLPEAEFLGCFLQLVGAVGAVHEAKLVHRDINPKNVLLDSRGFLKLIDFGLCVSTRTVPTRMGGTLGYLAPEVLRDGKDGVGPSADIYAVGFLAYQALLGLAPFKKLYAAPSPRDWMRWVLSREPFRPLHTISTDVSADVSAVVSKLIEKDPADRYRSLAEALVDLRRRLSFRGGHAHYAWLPAEGGSK
jgi:serine/threonine protein kinase